jgi:cytochrome c553
VIKALVFLLAAAVIPKTMDDPAYYQLPTRVIYKSYPVYHPDREPEGYMEWLKKQEPEILLHPTGEQVFNSPTSFNPVLFSAEDLRDRTFYEKMGMPVAKDGTVPFATWVIREKGKVEMGSMGCNTCHTRVMADGAIVPGAQGNNPGDREGAYMLRRADPEKAQQRVMGFTRQFKMPPMSVEELLRLGEAIPPGVTARAGTSLLVPPQIPDLIGVQERYHLDHTGLFPHRSVRDMMRYITTVTDVNAGHKIRYSDENLYALAEYLYSLKPPANPNPPDAAGRKVFDRAGCARCHTPPLFTNNERIPAAEIGTDPRYTTDTPKATGYYTVPSLKGVWYRGRLEHNGRAASLEEWFDPERKIPGHRFGLDLKADERKHLIAFLRSL